MISLLLVVIYLAFISLGLPDSLLGSGWPSMHIDFDVPLSYAGIITMLISFGTIISSLMSDNLTKKFGSGVVCSVSVLLTACMMMLFSVATNYFQIVLLSVPYGLGAGAIDACLNNYVALHYSSRHMSWLHCFWGVGASISPYIMSFAVLHLKWNYGYRIVSLIQIALTLIMFLSLPLWKQNEQNQTEQTKAVEHLSVFKAIKIKGVTFVLVMFLCYCALEQTAMLWASSYLVNVKMLSASDGAKFGSMFALGITGGRFLSGFVSEKLGDKNMIKLGLLVITVGIFTMILSFESNFFSILSFCLIGLGCAPIYPSIIHSTPENFGKDNSQSIIGIEMAFAYIGTTFTPTIFGAVAGATTLKILPYFLLFVTFLLILFFNLLNKVLSKK